MIIKTFWIIFLKITGMILLVRGIGIALEFSLNTFIIYQENTADAFYGITMFIVALIIHILLPLLLLFKSAWVMEVLHLDRGFPEDKIELTARGSSVISVAIIIIGAYLVIESLPELFIQILNYINMTKINRQEFESVWIFFHAVKLILGYLIMTNSKSIVLLIEKQNTSHSEVE